MRWGMVIDVRRCEGCGDCVMACAREHRDRPGLGWQFLAAYDANGRSLRLPVQCMHCAEPPCVPICPTGASRRRADGIVLIDDEVCV
ncbi:MAG: molybdopterin oxidoreductase, partial [Candidatus Rokubacteria bacterium]|nr:molybdopterin oxidoreductase [Candidatus Rokubacteria bacterium]